MAKFYGIGVGPGDKELLTLKAVRVLSMLDVLILPVARKNSGSISLEIAKEFINNNTELRFIEFPMVQDYEKMLEAGRISAYVVEKAVAEGKNVGFITLGDPSIYSTYGYILKNLSADVEVETIPGITSFCGAAALLNKPLVEREEILSIIPSTANSNAIEKAIEASSGMAFMKVFNHSQKVCELLGKNNLMDNSVLVKRCGMSDCSIEDDVKMALDKDKQYLSIIVSRKEKG